MNQKDPPVAVLLPTLNGEEFIGEQIDALATQACDLEWHLVVIDGGSSDATLDVVEAKTAGRIPTRVVRLSGAPGVNAGLNAGVVATDSRLLLIAEHDDVVADGWMDALVNALSDEWLVGSHMERFRLNDPDVTGSRRPFNEEVKFPVPVAAATGMGFRRELWSELGGFDESYVYGGNDLEYCLRAADIGHPVTLVDGAVVHYRARAGVRPAYRQGQAYGVSTVRVHTQFGSEVLPRRAFRVVARDYARLGYWCLRSIANRSYRMRVAFRGGLLIGYLRGSLKYRRLFL